MAGHEFCIEEKIIIIRKDDLFMQLKEEDFEQLNIIHNFIVAKKNDYIYFDCHYSERLFFIKEGCIRLGNIDDEGNHLVKEILKPQDVFGQFTLVKNNLHGEFAQAYKSDVTLCSFNIEDFKLLLDKRPELGIVYSKKIGNRLRKVENRILNFLHKDVRTRLLHFFWTCAEEIEGNNAGNAIVIDNYFIHDDIARLIGSSRQTVTTLINQLNAEGLITVDRQNIAIHNIPLLRKLAKIG